MTKEQSHFSLEELLDYIERKEAAFNRDVSGVTSRGNLYGFGGIKRDVCVSLYDLLRARDPVRVVETGVCNGVTTSIILTALAENRHEGVLYSIDKPEYAGKSHRSTEFWAGKKGAVVPGDKQPGWLVPEVLRRQWVLVMGRSQEELPRLLKRVGNIDFFLHDSEHSFDCMMFEYRVAWRHLNRAGVLASDDVNWNNAFYEFAHRKGRQVFAIGRNMSYIVK